MFVFNSLLDFAFIKLSVIPDTTKMNFRRYSVHIETYKSFVTIHILSHMFSLPLSHEKAGRPDHSGLTQGTLVIFQLIAEAHLAKPLPDHHQYLS